MSNHAKSEEKNKKYLPLYSGEYFYLQQNSWNNFQHKKDSLNYKCYILKMYP